MTCLRCLVFGHDFTRRDFGHGWGLMTVFGVATLLLVVEQRRIPMSETRRMRVRLEEVLIEIRTLDSQLEDGLSLDDSIAELETAITVYESVENSEDN